MRSGREANPQITQIHADEVRYGGAAKAKALKARIKGCDEGRTEGAERRKSQSGGKKEWHANGEKAITEQNSYYGEFANIRGHLRNCNTDATWRGDNVLSRCGDHVSSG